MLAAPPQTNKAGRHKLHYDAIRGPHPNLLPVHTSAVHCSLGAPHPRVSCEAYLPIGLFPSSVNPTHYWPLPPLLERCLSAVLVVSSSSPYSVDGLDQLNQLKSNQLMDLTTVRLLSGCTGRLLVSDTNVCGRVAMAAL
eukprot:267037-Prorocentrum_minimum.AAC.2